MLSAKPRNPYPVCSTPAYVGGTFTNFAGTTGTTSVSLTSLTGGLASAPSENDIVIVAYHAANNVAEDLDMSVTGYTEICDLTTSFKSNLTVAYKVMTATPDTSVTVSKTGSDTQGSGAVAIHVYRGQDLSTPFPVTAVTATGGSTAAVDPPQIVSSYVGALILCAGGAFAYESASDYTASDLSNFVTTHKEAASTMDSAVGLGSIVSTGGPKNPAAWTITHTASISSWCAATLLLKGA